MSLHLYRALWLVCLAARGCTPNERPSDTPPDVAQPAPARTNSEATMSSRCSCPPALAETRRGGTDADRYVVPTDAERDALRDVARRIIGDGAKGRAAASAMAAGAGFEIVDVPELPGVVLVRELDSQRRGGGAYLLRPDSRSTLVVQAPHTFFDEGTLPLACELFAIASARALYIDTAHRYKAADADERGEHPADVAHARSSLYQAMTEGLLGAEPRSTIVQLHGFARHGEASVILSSGRATPGDPLVGRAAELLATIVGDGVQRFPEDTNELGATTNVQARAARRAGARFLHVEIGADARKSLLSNGAMRARFLQALAASTEAG